MNSKESAMHDAFLKALNQFNNYIHEGVVLNNVTIRELTIKDCKCYPNNSMKEIALPPESLEHTRYSDVLEIEGMIDFDCQTGKLPSGSQHFIAKSISFNVTHEYINLKDRFHAAVANDSIVVQFNL